VSSRLISIGINTKLEQLFDVYWLKLVCPKF